MSLPPPSGPPAGATHGHTPDGPGAGSGSIVARAGRRYLTWPLWTRIAAPGATAILALGAVGAATQSGEEAQADDTAAAVAFADLPEQSEDRGEPAAAETTAAPTTAASTTVAPTTVPPTTAPPTTAPPTTAAPTTAPPTTTPPTAVPTTAAPTTVAPTLPPTTPAPPPPPPPPPPPAPAAATDPDYGTCKEAKAHGAGPYVRGQDPEYHWYRDADKDGIVCE